MPETHDDDEVDDEDEDEVAFAGNVAHFCCTLFNDAAFPLPPLLELIFIEHIRLAISLQNGQDDMG